MKTEIVSFQVHGDFITNHFRTLVIEGEWRKAIEGLKDSLIDIPMEYVYCILSGQYQLDGINELNLVEDNVITDQEWMNKQYYNYFKNVYFIGDKFYQKYHTLDYFQSDDMHYALDTLGLNSLPINLNKNEKLLMAKTRAEFYTNISGDIALIVDNQWCLFKEIKPDYPVWLSTNEFMDILKTKNKDLTETYNTMLYELESVDIDHFIEQHTRFEESSNEILDNYIQSQNKIKNLDLDALKLEISKKADENGGWLEFTNPSTKKQFKIPKNPFLRWCLNDNPLYNTIKWGAVSPSGMKMSGDDPNHTDWFLFTGIDLKQGQNINNNDVGFLFTKRSEYFTKYTNSNLAPLVRGTHKGFETAKVIHINKPQDVDLIKPDTVVIIPNLDPDFEMVAHRCSKNNCIIISQTGGKLCHLAKVGREFGSTIYLLPDAFELIPKATNVKIDTESDNIKLLDYEGKDFENLLKLKLSGLHYKF